MRYVPYFQLEDRPNIIVDGEANAKTILTLSHWPNSGTHERFQDDLSAQIVFNFLTSEAAPEYAKLYGDELAVSNNHFDEDGLVSLFAMLEPDEAMERREFLIDVAAAGDFGVYRDRDAARVAFVLSAWTRSSQSPLNDNVFRLPYIEFTNVLYEELLPRFVKLMDKLTNLSKFWVDEDAFLDRTEEAIAAGTIAITQNSELDLAIVDVPYGGIMQFKERPPFAMSWISSVLHPMGVHNATDCMRILVRQKRHYEMYFRYETWVDFRSRKLKPRIDLTGLAVALTNEEIGRRRWICDPPQSIVPRLKIADEQESSIPPDVLEEIVKDFFTEAQLSPSHKDLLF